MIVGKLKVDRYSPGVRDGACQGLRRTCRLGYVLNLSNNHYFKAKANLGQGTNNLGEFKALLFLMNSTLDEGIKKLQYFSN